MKAGWIEFGAGFSSICAAKSFAAQDASAIFVASIILMGPSSNRKAS